LEVGLTGNLVSEKGNRTIMLAFPIFPVLLGFLKLASEVYPSPSPSPPSAWFSTQAIALPNHPCSFLRSVKLTV
jgi:hypothetical protein